MLIHYVGKLAMAFRFSKLIQFLSIDDVLQTAKSFLRTGWDVVFVLVFPRMSIDDLNAIDWPR